MLIAGVIVEPSRTCVSVCVLAFVKKKSIKGKTAFAESGGVLKRQKGCAALGGCGRS